MREYAFEAAHLLPCVPPDHKCARLHGHSYSVVVHVEGEVDSHTGMVIEFGEIDVAVRPLLADQLDHRYLNDIAGLENPTAENLARWIWEQLLAQMPMLRAIEVRETATSAVIYEGEKTKSQNSH